MPGSYQGEGGKQGQEILWGGIRLGVFGYLSFCPEAFLGDKGCVSDVTGILHRAQAGDPKAAAELLPLVYDELRKLAAHRMSNEASGQTLQPTALVHEVWLKLAGSTEQQWRDRRHFFGAAAEAMRRILIDRARKRKRSRHGHGLERVNLGDVDLAATANDETLLAVDEALTKLSVECPERAELVKLRYYVGLSIPDAAKALGISESTAKRQWTFARAWLFRELKRAG